LAGLEDFIDRRCVVHLRRDAAGVAGQAPMAMSEDDRFGRAASVQGTLRRATARGVLVEMDRGVRWVPIEVILAVDFPTAGARVGAATRRFERSP
jgi:hypothetical protein